jgi:hypothetical protein
MKVVMENRDLCARVIVLAVVVDHDGRMKKVLDLNRMYSNIQVCWFISGGW